MIQNPKTVNNLDQNDTKNIEAWQKLKEISLKLEETKSYENSLTDIPIYPCNPYNPVNIAAQSHNVGRPRAKFSLFRNYSDKNTKTSLLSPNILPQDSLESRTSEDFSDAELPNLQRISQAETTNMNDEEFSRSYG